MNILELTSQDVAKILKLHNDFFETQATKSLDFRIEQLKKLRTGIEKYESRISAALKIDLGNRNSNRIRRKLDFYITALKKLL